MVTKLLFAVGLYASKSTAGCKESIVIQIKGDKFFVTHSAPREKFVMCGI